MTVLPMCFRYLDTLQVHSIEVIAFHVFMSCCCGYSVWRELCTLKVKITMDDPLKLRGVARC